jgi:hypothetical protein
VVVGADRPRDDIDVALDDVFGAPDDRGPGTADAVLVAGGGGVVLAGLLASWPAIAVVAGGAAVGLGLILPVRSSWRRVTARRRDGARIARRADGTLLRADGELVGALVTQHELVRDRAATLSTVERLRVESVAHAALREVATLLGDREPTGAAEVEYVSARLTALTALAQAAAASGTDRATNVAARHEVEQLGGSSLDDAAALVNELGGDDLR